MSEIVIDVQKVSKYFSFEKKKNLLQIFHDKENSNRLTALDDISFSVTKGEVFGIIGQNGSGKTTLLRTIADIFQPDKGKVSKNGKLAPILQISGGFNLELKPSENIVLYGMLLGVPKSEIKRKIPYILEFAELEKFSTMKLKHFSSGMLARLSFSTVLQINPDIFLFDEILSVGDLKFKEKVLNTFPSFKEKNKTVLYSTHNLGSLVTLCDRVLLLHHGKQIMIDKPKKVVQKYRELVGIEK